MVFLSRNRKPKRKEIEFESDLKDDKYSKFFSQVYFVEKYKLDMPPELEFVKETIDYRNRTKRQFEKKSHSPKRPARIMGKQPSVPGVDKAIEESKLKDPEYFEDMDSLVSIINEYGREIIDEYNEDNVGGMVDSFYDFKKSLKKVYGSIEENTRNRGDTLVAATRQIQIEFLEHLDKVNPLINEMEKSKKESETDDAVQKYIF